MKMLLPLAIDIATFDQSDEFSLQLQCICYGMEAPYCAASTKHSYNCLEKISGLVFVSIVLIPLSLIFMIL